MAKKRDLKQTINYICSELFAEAVAASLYGTSKSEEAAENVLSAIIITKNDFVKRISHPEPGMDPKKYYDQIVKDFNHRVSEIIDQISSLG
ncbi:MAG: hypothetical protein I3J02_00375 [Prevotella sp.]|nr:hypothetical protein [Prevotella sp.]